MKSLLSIFSEKNTSSPMMRGAAAAITVESANKILTDLFGTESAGFVKAVYVKNGVLGVQISSSSAASEIRLNESLILDRIRTEFGVKSINKIRFIL